MVRRGTAVLGATALVALMGSSPALADPNSGSVEVVNTETVQVYMSPDATVQTKRVYEQLAMTGHGTVNLLNPVSTSGLRNLDGFGGIDVQGGNQVVSAKVDGEKKTRSVSDFTGKLPLDVAVAYTLDGKSVKPGDVVGRSGKLAVEFTVSNVTGERQTISFADGKGGTVTKTVDVVVPIVGSVSTVAPANFTNVRSKQANMAGDGQGGTQLSFTMTLFQPVGSTTATFGYTADVKDGVVPRVEISALPVNPLESPTFKSASDSYQGGADTGAQLTDGAVKIDGNLLRLRDGSADLLAGLIKLRTGADELNTGLADTAAPGAKKLAAGATALDAGLFKLKDGARKLSGGTGDLAVGAGSALAGSKKLTAGLKQISGGLGQLSGQLPSATDGIDQLKAGIDKLIAGMGTEANDQTLIGGLKALNDGLAKLKGGSTQLKGGLSQLVTGLGSAKGGVDQSKGGLDGAIAQINPGDLDSLSGGIAQLKQFCAGQAGQAQCEGLANALITGVGDSKSKLTALKTGLNQVSGGLGQVSTGLGGAINALNTQLIPGAGQIEGGLGNALTGVTKLRSGAGDVKTGLSKVKVGLLKLADGVTAAIDGVNKLSDGAGSAYNGSTDLTAGLGKIDSGASQLDDGAKRLADGAGKAVDGSGQVADGAKKLSDGLGAAADGSGQLSAGLDKAAGAAPQLPHGASRLSKEGTKKLIAAGESTTQTYGENVAVIKAGADRADAHKMAYGAPKGAAGLTAYSYVIEGTDGEGRRNLTRTLGGLALLAAGAGAIALRRRLL